jgi:hypothetical protein
MIRRRIEAILLEINFFSISIPTAEEVGKSGDMVWVRSTAEVNLRAGAASARSGTIAVAVKPAATAPLKKPRRDNACRTAC